MPDAAGSLLDAVGDCADAVVTQSDTAAPMPAIAATFSVPARAPRSWPPPLMSGSRCRDSERLMSAPTPLGAPILWPEIVMKSAPSALISQENRPAAWTASTCRSPPASVEKAAQLRKPVEQPRFHTFP